MDPSCSSVGRHDIIALVTDWSVLDVMTSSLYLSLCRFSCLPYVSPVRILNDIHSHILCHSTQGKHINGVGGHDITTLVTDWSMVMSMSVELLIHNSYPAESLGTSNLHTILTSDFLIPAVSLGSRCSWFLPLWPLSFGHLDYHVCPHPRQRVLLCAG